MSSYSRRLPFDVKEVYGDHPVRAEMFRLENEAKGSIGGRLARVRLLTDFVFVKAGKLVYPRYNECTTHFWDGVEAWGFMMSPTGHCKWFAWSLNWWLDWPGKHMELVRIDYISGISKERDPHYRNGNETALWLNTKQGYSYALMEPDDIAVAGWLAVLKSWEHVGQAGLPICRPANPGLAPPEWWHHKGEPAGKQAWQRLVAKHQDYEKRMEAEDSSDGDDETPVSKQRSSKGKSKAQSSSANKRRRPHTASSIRSSTKASSKVSGQPPASTSKSAATAAKSLKKRTAEYIEIDPIDEEGASGVQVTNTPSAPVDSERGTRPPPSKRSRMLTVAQLAAPPPSPQAVKFAERPEPEETQQEAQRSQAVRSDTPRATPPPPRQDSTISWDIPDAVLTSMVLDGAPSQPALHDKDSQLAHSVQAVAIAPAVGEIERSKEAQVEALTADATVESLAVAYSSRMSGTVQHKGMVDSTTENQGRPPLAPQAPPPNEPDPPATSAQLVTARASVSPPAAPLPLPSRALSLPPPPRTQSPPVALPYQPRPTPPKSAGALRGGHEVIPVPGPTRHAALSLDGRSSRRHTAAGHHGCVGLK